MGAALTATGCSARHGRASEPTTTLIHQDTWVAPAVVGPPSTHNFCSLLVAMYEHEAQIPEAANTKVKEQIVQDYIDTVPKVLAETPPALATSAPLYLHSVAQILSQLEQAGLNPTKVRGGNVAGVLLDPAVRTAGNQVLAYSSEFCHYNIGS